MQRILFCGMQATGKATFYQQRFFHSHVRISLDVRRTRYRKRRLLPLCLETQTRCVADNPTWAERAVYIEAARLARFEVAGYHKAATSRNGTAAFGLRMGASTRRTV